MNRTIIFIFLFFHISLFSQIEQKDIPYAFTKKINYAKIKPFLINNFDKEKLLLNANNKNNPNKRLDFAKAYETHILFDDNDVLKYENFNIAYKKIIVQNAEALALTFGNYKLLKGEKIFIFDASHKYLIGAFTSQNNKKSMILPTRFIASDTLIVEYHFKSNSNKEPLYISWVAVAYRDISKSQWCEININCDDDSRWQTIKKSVAKIYFKDDDNSHYVCTGSLIANTKQDTTPYFITANHCINSEAEANSAIFYFNYESNTCDGTSGDEAYTVAGASLISTADYHLDYSLLLLSEVPPESYNPYYSGWSRIKAYSDTSICIHQPDGDIKKISKDYTPLSISYFPLYDFNKHWNVNDWDEGTTEGGSSGSGLFTVDGLLIGTLSGGTADCDNNDSDQFQQFYHMWDDYNQARRQVNYWLDPFNFDPLQLNGYDPYKNTDLLVPVNFSAQLIDSTVTISWQEPSTIPDKYIIYKNLEIIDEVDNPQLLYDEITETGVYVYYATAVYSNEESKPSEMKSLVFGDTTTIPKITEINIFPNPTNGNITILTQDSIPMTKIEIFNNNSQLVKSFDVAIQSNFTMDISDFLKSIYYIKIHTTGDIYYKKIIFLK